jgi:hypothetical protein
MLITASFNIFDQKSEKLIVISANLQFYEFFPGTVGMIDCVVEPPAA